MKKSNVKTVENIKKELDTLIIEKNINELNDSFIKIVFALCLFNTFLLIFLVIIELI